MYMASTIFVYLCLLGPNTWNTSSCTSLLLYQHIAAPAILLIVGIYLVPQLYTVLICLVQETSKQGL